MNDTREDKKTINQCGKKKSLGKEMINIEQTNYEQQKLKGCIHIMGEYEGNMKEK